MMNWEAILNYLMQVATTWGIKLLKAIVVLLIALKMM